MSHRLCQRVIAVVGLVFLRAPQKAKCQWKETVLCSTWTVLIPGDLLELPKEWGRNAQGGNNQKEKVREVPQ